MGIGIHHIGNSIHHAGMVIHYVYMCSHRLCVHTFVFVYASFEWLCIHRLSKCVDEFGLALSIYKFSMYSR